MPRSRIEKLTFNGWCRARSIAPDKLEMIGKLTLKKRMPFRELNGFCTKLFGDMEDGSQLSDCVPKSEPMG